MFVVIFVASIAAVIMFHEFGHYATAKLFGMKTERFFFGFGPTLWSFRPKETEYGIKAIPAGGFVKIAGMSRYEEVDPADHGRLFYERPAWQRVIVLSAGSFTHFLVAFALIFAALAFVGVPTDEGSNQVAAVEPDSPADRAGFAAGDFIVAIDGTDTPDFEAVRAIVGDSGGETLDFTVRRDASELSIQAEIASENPEGETRGFLGIRPSPVIDRSSIGEAIAGTFSGDYSVLRLTGLTLSGLGRAFSPDALSDFFGSVGSQEPRSLSDEGPSSLVGAGQIVNQVGTAGDIFGVLTILASLNIVLGTLNMLPLPPLDGGHVAVLAVEEGVNATRRMRGNRERWHLDPSVITPIAVAVILFFAVLSFTAIYVDITNPITDALQ